MLPTASIFSSETDAAHAGGPAASFALPFTSDVASDDSVDHSDGSGLIADASDGAVPDGWFLA